MARMPGSSDPGALQAAEITDWLSGIRVARRAPMRRYLLGFALLGLVGCFLPMIGGTSISLFDVPFRTLHPWLVAAAFAAPALAAWRAGRASVIVAAVSFGYLALRLGPRSLDLVLY